MQIIGYKIWPLHKQIELVQSFDSGTENKLIPLKNISRKLYNIQNSEIK